MDQNSKKIKFNAFVVTRLDIPYAFQVFLFEMTDVERDENSLLGALNSSMPLS